MPKITIAKEKKEIEVASGVNLRAALQKEGVEVYKGVDRYLNCMGNGLCGKCAVIVTKGAENLSPKGKMEKLRLLLGFENIGHEDDMRLSCQSTVNGDCTVEARPEFNWSGENFWQRTYPNK